MKTIGLFITMKALELAVEKLLEQNFITEKAKTYLTNTIRLLPNLKQSTVRN